MKQKLEELKISDVFDASKSIVSMADLSLQFVDTAGASKILGVAEGTLIVWRSQRRYPLAYYKIGRKVLYHIRDLWEFAQSRRVIQTAPESQHIGKSPHTRKRKLAKGLRMFHHS